MARALFYDPEIAIFDDVFSGLDNQTARQVFRSVFETNGLLRRRGATILLATQSGWFLIKTATPRFMILTKAVSLFSAVFGYNNIS